MACETRPSIFILAISQNLLFSSSPSSPVFSPPNQNQIPFLHLGSHKSVPAPHPRLPNPFSIPRPHRSLSRSRLNPVTYLSLRRFQAFPVHLFNGSKLFLAAAAKKTRRQFGWGFLRGKLRAFARLLWGKRNIRFLNLGGKGLDLRGRICF